jgi:hypothetical protein
MDKPLPNQTEERRAKTKIIKLEMKKGILHQIPMKFEDHEGIL